MLSRPHDTQAKTECPDHTHRAERVTHSPSFISAISPTPPFQALSIIPSDSCQSIPLTAIIPTPQWMQTAKSPDPSVTPTDPHARSRVHLHRCMVVRLFPHPQINQSELRPSLAILGLLTFVRRNNMSLSGTSTPILLKNLLKIKTWTISASVSLRRMWPWCPPYRFSRPSMYSFFFFLLS